MNDLILMAIEGGRYLDAEKQIGDLVVIEPNSEAFYLLGTIKMNLLLSKERNFAEVKFCFDKALNLSSNRSQTEKDIMVFSLGIFKQLIDLQRQFEEEKKKQRMNLLAGIATTFVASKFYEDSKSTFGSVGAIVGISFGVGMSLEALRNIGDIPQIIILLEKLKKNIFTYLEDSIKIERKMFEENILQIENSSGKFQRYNNDIDIQLLKELNRITGRKILVDAAECVEMTKSDPYRWSRNLNNKILGRGDGFKNDSIICGISIESNKLNFILTSKGVFHHYGGFLNYSDRSLKVSSNLLGVWIGIKYFGPNRYRNEIANNLNLFFSQMKNLN